MPIQIYIVSFCKNKQVKFCDKIVTKNDNFICVIATPGLFEVCVCVCAYVYILCFYCGSNYGHCWRNFTVAMMFNVQSKCDKIAPRAPYAVGARVSCAPLMLEMT